MISPRNAERHHGPGTAPDGQDALEAGTQVSKKRILQTPPPHPKTHTHTIRPSLTSAHTMAGYLLARSQGCCLRRSGSPVTQHVAKSLSTRMPSGGCVFQSTCVCVSQGRLDGTTTMTVQVYFLLTPQGCDGTAGAL